MMVTMSLSPPFRTRRGLRVQLVMSFKDPRLPGTMNHGTGQAPTYWQYHNPHAIYFQTWFTRGAESPSFAIEIQAALGELLDTYP